MEVSSWTGSRLLFPPFDLNRDGAFSNADLVTLPDGSHVVPSGLQWQKCLSCGEADPEPGINTEPGVLVDPVNNVEYKYLSSTTGKINVITENPGPGVYGRQSWRQRR
jgi:type IV pilus assembly protein PilY1